jgi:hypothetical protein
MNGDPIKHELMKHVERIVRPVVAPTPRKMEMRRELLNHLTELYERECAACPDPATASESAARKLGDRADLTAQFQSSVSRAARWGARFNEAWNRRRGETASRHAVRVSALAGLASAIYMLLAMLICLAIGALSRTERDVAAYLQTVYFGVTLCTVAGTFFGALVGQAIVRALRRKAWPLAVAAACFAGPVFFLLIAGSAAVLAGNVAYMFTQFPTLYALFIVAPVMMLGCAMAAEHERRRHAEWTELAI